jgi:hypothetical protein
MDRHRGVSDALSFILVFSIVLAGVGVVTAGGFTALTELTDRQQIENADRGMSALAVTIDSLHRSGDTYREPSLTVSDAEVNYNETQLNITSDNSAFNNQLDSTLPNGGNLSVNAIEHRFDRPDGELFVRYEAGAVFRTRSVSPQYGPSFRCESGPDGQTQAIVSVVNLSAGTSIIGTDVGTDRYDIQPTSLPDGSLTNTENAQNEFEVGRAGTARTVNQSFDGELAVDVTGTAEPNPWGQYFSNSDNEWNSGGSSGVYYCDADTALVRVTTVDISVIERRSE